MFADGSAGFFQQGVGGDCLARNLNTSDLACVIAFGAGTDGFLDHATQLLVEHDREFAGGRAIIIGNIAAMSEGVDLSAADTIVFVECTWSTSALEQASSRVENINKSGIPPVIYILTIKASLDHNVLAKVLKKLNVVNQII